MDNPEKTETKFTDSQRGKVKESAYSSETNPHISVPVLHAWVDSVLKKKTKQTEEEDGAGGDKSVETAKEGDGS